MHWVEPFPVLMAMTKTDLLNTVQGLDPNDVADVVMGWLRTLPEDVRATVIARVQACECFQSTVSFEPAPDISSSTFTIPTFRPLPYE